MALKHIMAFAAGLVPGALNFSDAVNYRREKKRKRHADDMAIEAAQEKRDRKAAKRINEMRKKENG